uniref:Origin of replication complex subunit 1A-like n=1 Tax=Tanacetum cinerariifolium TaxID=118510 RepID=A0A6L2L6D4_TANCI|nr:origin of replication complex subunit 1A-like [Tanacetum cinerariifolium]
MLEVGGIANLALLGSRYFLGELKESLSYALKAGNFLMVMKIQTIHAHFLGLTMKVTPFLLQEIMGKWVRECCFEPLTVQRRKNTCLEATTKSCGRSKWGSSDTTDAGYALSSMEGHLEMEFFDVSQSKKPLLTCYVNRREEDKDSDEGPEVEEYVLKLGGVLWKEIDGSFWFQGRWYIFPKEKAAYRQPHNSKKELYRTNDFADNEMETVLRDCYVMTPNEYVKTVKEGEDVFLCEYEYDVKYHSFKRIAETDNHEESCNEDSESESDDDIEYEKEEKFKSLHGSTPAHVVAATALEKAKATLLLSTMPKSLPCRTKYVQEMEEITTFIKGVICDDQLLMILQDAKKKNVDMMQARNEVVDHDKLIKLMQFLMGLDDVYQPIRSSILTREVLPEAKDAFVIISREESHRGIPNTSVKTKKHQVSAFNTKFNDANKRKGSGNWSNGNKSGNWSNGNNANKGNWSNGNKSGNWSYGLKGYTIDRCFEIIGYPPGFKRNPNLKPVNNLNNNNRSNVETRRGLNSLHGDDFDVVEGLEVQEEHPRCCQSKDSNDKEKLVHGKMVVKFKVLSERKRMCSLDLIIVGDEEVVVAEGVVVISSSLDMLTNSCLGGIMVSLIFLEGLEEEAFVEFMVEWCEEDENDDRNKEDDLFN